MEKSAAPFTYVLRPACLHMKDQPIESKYPIQITGKNYEIPDLDFTEIFF
jgi:hypothetical protein